MKCIQHFTPIILLAFLIQRGYFECPKRGWSRYHTEATGYFCKGQNITKIPNDIPATVEEINLSHNSIEVVTTGVFEDRTKCFRVDLSHNSVRQIQTAGFSGINCFHGSRRGCTIKVNWNKLKVLKGDMWTGLERVGYLYLNHNELTTISNSSFGHLDVRYLDLGYNRIIQVDPLSLQSMTSITFIYLSNNQLLWISCFYDHPPMVQGKVNRRFLYVENNTLQCQPKSCWVTNKLVTTHGNASCKTLTWWELNAPLQTQIHFTGGESYICKEVEKYPSADCLRDMLNPTEMMTTGKRKKKSRNKVKRKKRWPRNKVKSKTKGQASQETIQYTRIMFLMMMHLAH